MGDNDGRQHWVTCRQFSDGGLRFTRHLRRIISKAIREASFCLDFFRRREVLPLVLVLALQPRKKRCKARVLCLILRSIGWLLKFSVVCLRSSRVKEAAAWVVPGPQDRW